MSHESLPQGPESKNTLSPAEAKQHHERLKEKIESRAEEVGDNSRAELEARHEIKETAISAAEYSPTSGEDTAPTEPTTTTKQEKQRSFDTTMHHARKNMRVLDRSFSKVIHQPVVEKTSDALGKTVARPSGLMGAGVASFIGLLSIFGVAKYAGFELSGSEMPLLILIGLVTGLFVEWAMKSVRTIFIARSK